MNQKEQLFGAVEAIERIVDTVREPLLVLDRDLRVRLANRSFYQLFRLSKEQSENQLIFRLGNGEWNLPQLRTLLEDLVPNELTVEGFELDLTLPGAITKKLLLNARKLRYKGNHDESTLLAFEDTADRKLTERALRDNEQHWRNLFDRMAESYFVGEMLYDADDFAYDFRFLEVNSAFEKTTGLTNAEGRTVRDCFPSIQAELIQTYARVVSTGEAANFEVQIEALEGRWFEARAQRTGPGRFSVLYVEITDRKRAEEELLQTQRQQAALLDIGDRIRTLQDADEIICAAMEILGQALEVDLAGSGIIDPSNESVSIKNCWTSGRIAKLEGEYRLSDYSDEIRAQLERDEPFAVCDSFSDPLTAESRERWEALQIRASLNLPFFRDRRLVALLFVQSSEPRTWTASDLVFLRKVANQLWFVVERARVLQELRESEERLRRSLTEKETLLKEVHHRVKNNLQVVSSLLRMQGILLRDPEAKNALKESQHRVLSMALIHERLYGGKRVDEIDFADYAKLLVSELINTYQGRSAHVVCRFELSTVLLTIDQAVPCGLMLNELVTNALKYAYPNGRGGEIVIGLEEDPNGCIRLSVSDRGVGLPEGFDWRSSKSLGLPIVDSLARQIGGQLSPEPAPGASFTLRFPRELRESATA